ncbi:MAG: DUF1566 domain-containing protein [Spirochaetales bacterium]|nr:DUF1566 domain-containing protein [Spirochaetales bacterium]
MKNRLRISLMFLLVIFVVFSATAQDRQGNNRINSGGVSLLDVHGAGAQRSDPKEGDPGDYPEGHGPQGDVIRIFNYIRPVRLSSSVSEDYPIVDTNQTTRYGNKKAISSKRLFKGQDADYEDLTPTYKDNGDGTISDLNTGLMWQQDPGDKMTWTEAEKALKSFKLGGHSDWRLPSIKELYSLILFSGKDVSIDMNKTSYTENPFIDRDYFHFEYGDGSNSERIIDSQYMSSTKYVSTTMNGDETVFGVNFADGRIKGYPITDPRSGDEKKFFVIFVRGNENYGINRFKENGDGTVTDLATGLMWLKKDSGKGMNWKEALEWAENLDTAGYSDWRLPNAKELQSILDYSRSPDTSSSAAIDPIFDCSTISNEGNKNDYPFYWTSTTHADSSGNGKNAAYLAFGRALGFMSFGGDQDGGSQGGRGRGDEGNRKNPPFPPPRR